MTDAEQSSHQHADGHSADLDARTPSSEEYSVAFSPRQMAVGFAIIAGLIALGLRRRRKRRASATPTDTDD